MQFRSVAAGLVLAAGLAGTGASQASAWLHPGPTTQYPSAGGTWQYGFWNAQARSYYTVGRCHGSSVTVNGDTVRSANTAAGARSVAEKWALNLPGSNDAYYYRTC